MPKPAKQTKVGYVAVVVGAIALLVLLVPPLVIEPPAASLLSTAKELVTGKTSEAVASHRHTMRLFQLSSVGLGVLAIVLGGLAWFRKEDLRVALAGAGTGLVVMLWQWIWGAIVAGIVTAVVIIILFNA